MAIKQIGTMELDELIASGKTPLHTKTIEITGLTGNLKRGQLIGKSSLGTFGVIAESDTPYGILCGDVTAESSTVKAMVYVSGHFNGNKIIGYVAEDHYDDLRDHGIFVDNAIGY